MWEQFQKEKKKLYFSERITLFFKKYKKFYIITRERLQKKRIFYILQEIYLQGKFQKDFFIYILQGQFRNEKIFLEKKKIIYIFCKDNFKITRNYFLQKEKNILYFSDRKDFFPKRKNLLYISKIKTILHGRKKSAV